MLPAPPCRRPELLSPLIAVASALLVHVPDSSAAAMRGAVQRWLSAIDFWGVTAADVDERVVMAYIVARCAPPVGLPLPSACASPVLPATVATEIGSLRRAAALSVEGMAAFGPALSHHQVSAILRHIGARVRRLKTAKRALLLHEVNAAWQKTSRSRCFRSIRDGFALVVAFFFACRVRELLQMRTDDMTHIVLPDERPAIQIAFRQTKTRSTAFVSHDPFVVTCANPLLLDAFRAFDDVVEFLPAAPIFRKGPTDPTMLSREWFAAVVRQASPTATPHSCRVGCATELWAAGATLDEIMAVGRWASIAATLYVLGSLHDQVAATDRLGEGGLVYTTAGLQRSVAFDGNRQGLAMASTPLWKSIRGRLPDSDDVEEAE